MHMHASHQVNQLTTMSDIGLLSFTLSCLRGLSTHSIVTVGDHAAMPEAHAPAPAGELMDALAGRFPNSLELTHSKHIPRFNCSLKKLMV